MEAALAKQGEELGRTERVSRRHTRPLMAWSAPPALEGLNEPPTLEEVGLALHAYSIPHITIRGPQSLRGKRPVFSLGGELLRVEEFVTRVLVKSGYEVYKGEDASLLFAVLSFNFENSFFSPVCRAHLGASAEALLGKLGARVSTCLAQSTVSDDLLDQAREVLRSYYASYPPKQTVYSELNRTVRRLDRGNLLRVIKAFREMGYTTRGVPDLFISRNEQFWFAEVKTSCDALSPEQYAFLEHFSQVVGGGIAVIRVLPP